MATIFDRETLLDLTVNVIPLGIILFFGVGYILFNPWGNLDTFGYVIMIGLHVVPFVGLAILTYVSGKAIAGDEKRSSVFFQGQATLEGARERHEAHGELESDRAGASESTDEGEEVVAGEGATDGAEPASDDATAERTGTAEE